MLFKFVIVAALIIATITAESVHWQYRNMVCTTGNNSTSNEDETGTNRADCNIYVKETEDINEIGRTSPIADDCFEETSESGQNRTYCDLRCPKADTVYLLARRPQQHRTCFVFYTHRLERRGDDWYLWRNGACRSATITYSIRCEFLFSRSEFPSDNELFAKRKA